MRAPSSVALKRLEGRPAAARGVHEAVHLVRLLDVAGRPDRLELPLGLQRRRRATFTLSSSASSASAACSTPRAHPPAAVALDLVCAPEVETVRVPVIPRVGARLIDSPAGASSSSRRWPQPEVGGRSPSGRSHHHREHLDEVNARRRRPRPLAPPSSRSRRPATDVLMCPRRRAGRRRRASRCRTTGVRWPGRGTGGRPGVLGTVFTDR
jgi:hypothetical protein